MLPGTCTREDRPDGALDKESEETPFKKPEGGELLD
jgi:hypothetical protein